jgi:hypothetical protein
VSQRKTKTVFQIAILSPSITSRTEFKQTLESDVKRQIKQARLQVSSKERVVRKAITRCQSRITPSFEIEMKREKSVLWEDNSRSNKWFEHDYMINSLNTSLNDS